MVFRECGKGFFAYESTHKLSIWPAGTGLREGNKIIRFLGAGFELSSTVVVGMVLMLLMMQGGFHYGRKRQCDAMLLEPCLPYSMPAALAARKQLLPCVQVGHTLLTLSIDI